MVEQVEIKAEETTAEAAAEPVLKTERPEGLPEKFNSVEDMAKSYQELESKLGQPKAEESTSEPKADDNNLEIAEKATQAAGLDMGALNAEYAEKGELAQESYDALEKAGISREYVDQFIAGQQAVAAKQSGEVKAIAGGDEGYEAMTGWAKENLTDAEIEAYNSAVNSGNMETTKLAVTGLKARYDANEGSDPKLLSGKATGTGEKGFESWAQVTEAMKDARYEKDPAYQAEVQNKIANSNL